MTDESIFGNKHDIVHCKQEDLAKPKCSGCPAVMRFGKFGDFVCVLKRRSTEAAKK